jgi:low temperature requirement protein LtrA
MRFFDWLGRWRGAQRRSTVFMVMAVGWTLVAIARLLGPREGTWTMLVLVSSVLMAVSLWLTFLVLRRGEPDREGRAGR